MRLMTALLLLAPALLSGQASRTPYGVGERLEYDVSFGRLSVGSASLEVMGIDTVRGQPTTHVQLQTHAGSLFFRVNDCVDSWIDRRTGNALRFAQDLNEGRRHTEHHIEIFPSTAQFREAGDTLEPSVSAPLDDASFFYFLRTLPLAAGESYSFDRYFRPDRNPITVTVLRREHISVPAGEFDALVVRPVIKTRGIFAESGQAEIWLSDDPRHLMLRMHSHLSFGSINVELTSVRPPGHYIFDARP